MEQNNLFCIKFHTSPESRNTFPWSKDLQMTRWSIVNTYLETIYDDAVEIIVLRLSCSSYACVPWFQRRHMFVVLAIPMNLFLRGKCVHTCKNIIPFLNSCLQKRCPLYTLWPTLFICRPLSFTYLICIFPFWHIYLYCRPYSPLFLLGKQLHHRSGQHQGKHNCLAPRSNCFPPVQTNWSPVICPSLAQQMNGIR